MIEVNRMKKPRNEFCIVYTENERVHLPFMQEQLQAERVGWVEGSE
jgi:hypothetical protein